MNQNEISDLARLAVRKGINVQPGQILYISAPAEALPLLRACVKEGYAAGASEVITTITDEVCAHETYLHADEAVFDAAKPWQVEMLNTLAEKGAGFLRIIGEDPDLMADIDPNRPARARKAQYPLTKPYRKAMDEMRFPWSIVAYPTRAWAKKVYPELEEEEALETLWQAIHKVSRVEGDGLANWEAHKHYFDRNVKLLNDMEIDTLHYKNGLGTDLSVKLPADYNWTGGGSTLQNGTFYFPNIPTEEIFAAPFKTGVNGRLYASMPLVHNGQRMEDFWFEFKDGKVVDFDAKVGRDVLASILESDEGSRYLGEIALVPAGSAINALDTIFYNTLIDENAACHFALGQAYGESIKGGNFMSEEEQLAHGLNQSLTHVDFMVGTPDLSITAATRKGEEKPIFVNGKWSALFDAQ